MQKPVFFDPSGRRTKASFFGVMTLIGLAVALFIALVASILIVPIPQDLDLHMEYPHPRAWKIKYLKAPKNPILRIRGGRPDINQTIAAFYVPTDDASRASLEKHMDSLDVVIPGLATVTGPAHTLVYTPDYQFRQLMQSARHTPQELVMIQNSSVNAQNPNTAFFDGAAISALFAVPLQRQILINKIDAMLKTEKAQGVTFDFEDLNGKVNLDNYLIFIEEAHARLSKDGFQVTLTVPVDTDTWDLKAFAKAADKLFLMVYDQHSLVDPAGPIAAQGWFNDRLSYALKSVPLNKAVVCIGNYAHDWYQGGADDMTTEEAWLTAHDSEAQIQFDAGSGNPYYTYSENGVDHHVWILDAVTAWNQLLTIDNSNVAGVALWRMGSEDPAVWTDLAAFQNETTPNLDKLSPIGDVDVEGNGEIIHIDDTPKDGNRTVTFDKERVAQSEQYQTLPTPYVVRRTGYKPKYVALTFDDGPDGRWTPVILNILKKERVPATFFVIGEKAIDHPGLLNEMVRNGDDIGNHSYTHPNLAKYPYGSHPEWVRFELNSTQRVVEAYTGRSIRLFRAPFFGDAEPTTEDELAPALEAQKLGYTNVGLHIDSEDWTRPGVPAIIKNVVDGIHDNEAICADPNRSNECRSSQIVLMHDSGGIRTQTIAALPTVIETLKKQGYRFVTVGDLVGLTRDQVMPKLSGVELGEVRFDVGIFMALASLAGLLRWLFIIAIILGITRALTLSALAIYAEFSGHMDPPEDDTGAFVRDTFVSVIIPAYNEARVIENSIRRVLISTGVTLEIVVVDDGSKDDTSAIVAAAFAGEPRVRLITQANAGKAQAVNNGIAAATGEIIIALDADTQFEPETIARLLRWFIREDIGAVAGNAKVGNRFNFVTKWQAVEYVTSQNLERSALAMFDAMMVVPGAVGAWRRSALNDVGGYPQNTLAEDQDLTIAIQRRGWKVAYDQEAVAWTEAPESFGSLMKQRFRWAFGTLQCLWKHQRVFKTWKPKGLAIIGVPQAWIFQIGFSVISPLIDFALIVNIVATVVRVSQHGWAQNDTDLWRMLIYWVAFLTIDALCGAIAYWLEPREKAYPMFWLLSQRFVYRQIMYYVVIKALLAAWRGKSVGWGKLERSGRLDTPPKGEGKHKPRPKAKQPVRHKPAKT